MIYDACCDFMCTEKNPLDDAKSYARLAEHCQAFQKLIKALLIKVSIPLDVLGAFYICLGRVDISLLLISASYFAAWY